MKLNRRGMLGVAAGGMLAAPLSSGVSAFADVPPKLPYPYPQTDTAIQQPTKEWTLENLAKLKRLAAGDLRPEDKNYPTAPAPGPFQSLRSISDNGRHWMQNALYERQWRERTIKMALDALDNYDKTGILRTFF